MTTQLRQIYAALLRRRGQVPPVPEYGAAFAPYALSPNGGGTAYSAHFVEDGRLYHTVSGNAGSAARVGDKADWTAITMAPRGTGVSGGAFGRDSAGAVFYLAGSAAPAESLAGGAELRSGYYCAYTNASSNPIYTHGIAAASDGLYRLGPTAATRISTVSGWTALSGQLAYYNAANQDWALGIGGAGTSGLQRIAYDGTIAAVTAAGLPAAPTGIAGLERAQSGTADVSAYAVRADATAAITGHHDSTHRALAISGGALYRSTGPALWELVDDTGSWSGVWGVLSGTSTLAWGIRDGLLCTIAGYATTTWTATAEAAVAVGENGWHAKADGHVYTLAGARLVPEA